MIQSTSRNATRRILTSRLPVQNLKSTSSRRFLSTAPAAKPRGWRSSALRWGLAAAGIYYYNTSSIFAEETDAAIDRLTASLDHIQESKLTTVDAIVEERQRRRREQAEAEAQVDAVRQAEELAKEEEARAASAAQASPADHAVQESQAEAAAGAAAPMGAEGGLEGLEEEADQQGAFNPETGEINWDCPCLGGMAHGVCGEEFRAAFSCFVYSTEEPKGMDCIEKFKGMQDCFRAHPDVYGAELEDEEDEIEEDLKAQGLTKEPAEKPQPVAEAKAAAQPAVKEPESKSA